LVGGRSSKRERSTIEFPYGDLDDAVDVAKTVHKRGGDACSLDQLAAWLSHESVSSGTFRLKVAAARTFGLIEVERQSIVLSSLGHEVVDATKERGARSQAFLNVPLYRKIYDAYRGRMLPPDAGLESMMANLGVAAKQTQKARQAFQRSADQAGLFEQGRDRLVLPAGAPPTKELSETGPAATPPEEVRLQGLHPFIQGLLDELPKPGSAWPEGKREAWLETASSIFKLIYRGE